MRRRSFLLFIVLSAAYFSVAQDKLPTDYVNPFIGTGGHGHTYPGASLPFGMVQVSPDTRLDGWDGCSGYHYSDTIIYGFSHTHLSGTGCSDYGDILLMPCTGDVTLDHYGYASGLDKNPGEEIASPGYYKVLLTRYHIRAELTATLRAGLHRYTFPASEKSNIVIDLKHRDKVIESSLRITGDDEVEGMRISEAWAKKQIIYFVAKFSKPFRSYIVSDGHSGSQNGKNYEGKNVHACFRFSTVNDEKILVKVGISAVSIEGARKNLDQEIPGFDFEKIASDAAKAWDKELRKIEVEGGTRDQKIIFYTALYHALLSPNLYMDVDDLYRGRDIQVHHAEGFNYYTVFSLWDTYRAEHPLLTIIDQKRTSDFIRTFLNQYTEGGMLPVWELSANETGCMIGYHAVPVIADAYLKGIGGFDPSLALEASEHSANQDHLGLKYYKNRGYIPGDEEGESVSKTLEYAYDDWCIAQMAKKLGREDDYKTFIRRSQFYKNLYDTRTGFMRAKMNEGWFKPFDPAEVNFNYTEANAWQYSFYVPQDITGLMKLMGGHEKFARKLDELFSAPSETTGRDQADISGMIGQYAHGNEPSHHMAYLYDFAGEPWNTQELVHIICRDLYSNAPDGLCGNEDCGQMSAWFVLSAMGFYPVTPGSGQYVIGTPLFPKVTIHLENGRTFIISAANVSDQNFHIRSATLNGMHWGKSFLLHEDIMKGGNIEFDMGQASGEDWGTSDGDYPVTGISDNEISPVPSIESGQKTFTDSTLITLSCPVPGVIHYTLDGTEPSLSSMVYTAPFKLYTTTILKAFAILQNHPQSFTITARFMKISNDRKIRLVTKYAPQYSAGGDQALIDFTRGGPDFRTGSWQGYEGVDLDAVIDLGSTQQVSVLSAGFLQDTDSWIFMPETVSYSVSENGLEFKEVASVKNKVSEHTVEPVVREFSARFQAVNTRYIRVVAKNREICPQWHPGAGSKAWIFADEITAE